ncbi:hypothetical protein [Streptomyces sp. NBC_00620]|uniref:hypothetical protein n=1 Tax=Streptomyces sp. NBC_00620 TaxID=2903666 RepID=UPI00225AF65B|nr:hypothetical protein [Streptomyces sp. NBC_00620]MCX4972194.1 hypothetical protein [Streptomyces sp. NBC_00620]
MRWILLGALLGLLLVLCPALVVTLASQPIVVAFVLGLAARPRIARSMRRWAP